SRAFTGSDPMGQWYAFSTYKDAGGVWHDGPSVNFTVSQPAAGGLVISSPLTLDKTTVGPGGTLNGTVTYQNTGSSAISVLGIIIAGRPPGGTNAGGPYADLRPTLAAQAIAPGAAGTRAASGDCTAAGPRGTWYAY